jgi:hypothetical protein
LYEDNKQLGLARRSGTLLLDELIA